MTRVPTGVAGLDAMLGGGFPSGRCFLVCGGPGSGKTILGLQFLYKGAVEHREPGLYISLDESPDHIREEMMGFKWNLAKLEKDRLLSIIDASPIRTIPAEVKLGDIKIGKRDFSLLSLIKVVNSKIRKVKAKRIVIDPLTALTFQYSQEPERRNAILDLFQALTRLDTTSIVTSEIRTTALDRTVHPEEFLAHGVIVLHTSSQGFRAIQIEKMRGVSHDTKLRPYKISGHGIEVFPGESVLLK